MRRKKRRWRRRRGRRERGGEGEGGGGDHNSNAVFRSNATQFTHGPGYRVLHFLVNKLEEEEEEIDEELAVLCFSRL